MGRIYTMVRKEKMKKESCDTDCTNRGTSEQRVRDENGAASAWSSRERRCRW